MHVGQQMTVEDIAAQEGVSEQIVQRSIDCMKEYRFRHSNDMVALRVNEVVLSQLDGVASVFKKGLGAKKYVPIGGGEFKRVDDTAMQLKTVETLKSLHEVAQPKAPLVQNNTQFNNNVTHPAYQSGMSFEAKLRLARQRRGMSSDEDVVIDSAADVDEPQSVEDELADIGVDLNGDDEDGDEEE